MFNILLLSRFRNNEWLFRFFCGAALCLVPSGGFSLPYQQGHDVNAVIAKILNCQFDSAFRFCDSMIRNDQNDPMAWTLMLSTIAARDLDLDKTADSTRFPDVYRKTGAVIAAYEKKNGCGSYSFMIKGIAKAVAACYDMWRKSYIKGVDLGFEALSCLKEAKKLDSGNTDVDLFLGMYMYARAEMKQMFRWALFWYPGEKSEGIAAIANCKKTGRFAGPAAAMVLAELAIREKRFGDAAILVRELSDAHPKSRFVKWSMAKLFEAQSSAVNAAGVYRDLADEYDMLPSAQRNAMTARWKEASLFNQAGFYGEAETACRKLVTKESGSVSGEEGRILKDAAGLLEKLTKAHQRER